MLEVRPNVGQHTVGPAQVRPLTTTTKTTPQLVGTTPRWLLKLLPWINVPGGALRVNRKKLVLPDPEKIRVHVDNGEARIDPADLQTLPLLEHVDKETVTVLSKRFLAETHEAGRTIITEGDPGDKFYIIARGKVEVSATNSYGQKLQLALLGDGDCFGEMALLHDQPRSATVRTRTPCTFLSLARAQFDELVSEAPALRESLERVSRERHEAREQLMDEYGERRVEVVTGHEGEVEIPGTFVDYTEHPREYPLEVAQSIVRVQTRVSDLYNDPFDQLRLQVGLTVETMKERQESEMINSRAFGLLSTAAPSMRVQTRHGPPTPDDMDELLARVWKKPAFFLAHPRAIAAFGRECTRRGVPPPTVELFGVTFLTWRGIPIIPSDKLRIDGRSGATDILLMRVGEQEGGVVGLHQTGVPGEQMPSLSVRFMGIDNMAIASYLVTLYFSVAILVEDALGVLENVNVSHYYEYGA